MCKYHSNPIEFKRVGGVVSHPRVRHLIESRPLTYSLGLNNVTSLTVIVRRVVEDQIFFIRCVINTYKYIHNEDHYDPGHPD